MAAYKLQEVGLEEKRRHANSKAEKLKTSLQDVWFSASHDENARNDALRSIQDNTAKAKSEKRKADQYEEELQREERALEGIRDGLEDKSRVFRDRIEQKQKELQPWKAKVDQKQAEVDVKTSERDMLVKRAEAVEQASAEAHEALETAKSVQTAKIGELENLKDKRQSLQQETRAVEDLAIRVGQRRAQASSTRQRAEEAKASQAASASANEVSDSLTRLRDSGRVSGLHGPLRSLGTIPDEYDVAITTACGSLNDMVADTAQQGQACAEYLRNQNVGRADFLVLEEIDETNGMKSIQTPENVPRLFDLIEPKEPRFAHAFYKALRDTLVAQDLAQASRIAFGARRWRVVTLAGELIDSSGTISGGGPKPRGGGMGSKLVADAIPPDVLRQYEQDSEAAAARLTVAMEELRATESGLEAVGKSRPQIDLEIEKVKLDIQNAGKRVVDAEKRVRDLRTPSKPNAGALSRIASLEREIATARNELDGLRSPSSTIEEAIEALEREILDIGGSRLLAQKSKVDGLKLHIDVANEELTKAEVAMAKAERDSVKFERSIASNRQSLAGVEIELGKLSESLREVRDYVGRYSS
ncbi:SMCs flexible hinge [Lactarius pseudohatsudake]|nr:SMCs flexible hinge [Lactarius pseudohatsudake]